MHTVAQALSPRKSPVRHYAFLGEAAGIALLVPGGYYFTPDDGGPSRLAAYNSPDLMLLGHVTLADDQLALDLAAGSRLATVYGR